MGEDQAGPGGWFNIPHWLCYSSTDMRHWTAHGPVLKSEAFPYATAGSAWAAQMVERDGKYYFYVTLDRKDKREHAIDVAVSDSPTGPFVPARKDGTPLITDGMTPDSHRRNADIDPTVLIDDDGTPWMAWGNGDCYMVKLKKNMIELDGEIRKVPLRNYSEGPWLFKRGKLYYNVYASDAPGVQPEQIAYSTAPSIQGPWTYRGFVSTSANHGFTIHPSVIQFKGKWYYIYHDGSYALDGAPGGDCRRSVCAEPMHFNPDGTIRFVPLTQEGLSAQLPPLTPAWALGHIAWEDNIDNIYRSAQMGFGAVGTEIAGFMRAKSNKQQFIRYTQFGAMTACMINGGENGGWTNHLPWWHDQETTDIYRYCVTLHRELVPYLFSGIVDTHLCGGSLLQQTSLKEESHLLGCDLFTKAITSDDNQQAFTLPVEDQWIDFFTGQRYEGGSTVCRSFANSEFPLYVRSGAIIPMSKPGASPFAPTNLRNGPSLSRERNRSVSQFLARLPA